MKIFINFAQLTPSNKRKRDPDLWYTANPHTQTHTHTHAYVNCRPIKKNNEISMIHDHLNRSHPFCVRTKFACVCVL